MKSKILLSIIAITIGSANIAVSAPVEKIDRNPTKDKEIQKGIDDARKEILDKREKQKIHENILRPK